jgi:hypothetical protein
MREKKIKENRKRKGKGFRNLGEFLGKLGGRSKGILWGFTFSGVSVIFGTTVMVRRTDRRDRGVRGILGVVADSSAGAAGGGRRPECGRCRRDSRHARRG